MGRRGRVAAKPETVDGPRAGEVGSERGSERGREKEPPPLERAASASRMWLERHAWQECALYMSHESIQCVYESREYTVYDGLGAWVCSQLEPHPTRSEPS
eukprot:scaffold71414_cov50-Phaeocystis_antarctica.AAC.1